ncbi:hypothetical protein ACA910_002109 [Epithemia clementina (nom. ined.)]
MAAGFLSLVLSSWLLVHCRISVVVVAAAAAPVNTDPVVVLSKRTSPFPPDDNGGVGRFLFPLAISRGGGGGRSRGDDEDIDDEEEDDQEEEEEDDDDQEASPRPTPERGGRRRRRRPPPDEGRRPPLDSSSTRPPPLWSRLATQSAKLSGQALSATARASGQAAWHLATPKQVDWETELVGLWRLDEWRNDWGDRAMQSHVELTQQQTVLFLDLPSATVDLGTGRNNRHGPQPRRGRPSSRASSPQEERHQQQPNEVSCHFTPAAWPRSARLEFHHPTTAGLIYTCTVQRKLADASVLKLRGKIYELVGNTWGRRGRRVLVGTFMGRRRLQLNVEEDEEEDDDEDADEEEDDDENKEEEDAEEEEEGDWDDDE